MTGTGKNTSLASVRRFFDEDNCKKLAKGISGTPDDQLLVLAEHLILDARPIPYYGSLRRPAAVGRELPYVSDRLTEQWEHGQVKVGDNSFKHLILYCKTIAVPDPIIGWAKGVINNYEVEKKLSTEAQRDLSLIIKAISPLAQLIDVGSLTLFPPFGALGTDTGHVRQQPMGGLGVDPGEHILPWAEEVWNRESVDRLADAGDDSPDDVFFDHWLRRTRSAEGRMWNQEAAEYDFDNERWAIDSDSHGDNCNLDLIRTWMLDPFLQRLIIDQCAEIMSAELEILGLTVENEDDWEEIISQAVKVDTQFSGYDSGIAAAGMKRLRELLGCDSGLQRAVDFAFFVTRADVIPFCQDKSVSKLLQLVSERAVDGYSKKFDLSRMLPGAAFEIPSLTNVSLDEVIRLRAAEEIFDEVRSALLELQAECAARSAPDDWFTYQEAVSEMANDIVGPTHARLKKQLRSRSFLSSLVGVGVGGATSLGVEPIATAIGAPGAASHLVGRPVGQKAKNIAQKKLRAEQMTTAQSILVELISD